MRPLDSALAQKIAEANDPYGFRDLVLTADGVRPEAQDFIRAKCPDFSIRDMPGYGGGWFPPATLDGVGKVQLASWQTEACLHESSHVWWHWERQLNTQNKREILCFQVAVYAMLDSVEAHNLGIATAETIDFFKGYYYGIGQWLGMYALDGSRRIELGQMVVNNKWVGPHLDMANMIDWEIFGGICSFTMGQFKTGPHRLPRDMWWLFDQFFTGEILVTPRYEGGIP